MLVHTEYPPVDEENYIAGNPPAPVAGTPVVGTPGIGAIGIGLSTSAWWTTSSLAGVTPVSVVTGASPVVAVVLGLMLWYQCKK